MADVTPAVVVPSTGIDSGVWRTIVVAAVMAYILRELLKSGHSKKEQNP